MLRSGARAIRCFDDNVISHSAWAKARCINCHQRAFASRRKFDPTIKWFKQDYPESPGREETDPEHVYPDPKDLPEARALRAKIDQLGAEIADLAGHNKPSLIEPLIATLSPEDQAKVRKALAEEEEEEDELYETDISLTDLPKLEKLGPKLNLELGQTVYLRKLDKCLRNAADDVLNPSTRLDLWSTYRSSKRSLPKFLHLVPNSAFRVLWESQTNSEGPQRASHLCVLAQDMIENGKDLSEEQALFYIDSLIRQARVDDAHKQWQKESSRLDNNDSTRLEYRYLGIRIFCCMDEPEKAQELAMSLLPVEKDKISSVLVPIIIAWIIRGGESSLKCAWALYLRLRTELGSQITITDFDNISLTFLNCGQIDMALAVFKDLMLSGKDTPETSDQLYRASLRLIGEMHTQSIDLTQVTKVSLAALIAMPRRFQNKYFYGSWMKRLIGQGEVDAAAAVIELMMERGVKPDAKHMNGILAAWLRNGSEKERAKAEQMGWAMIAQRLDFVKARRGQPLDASVQEEKLRISRWPKHVRRFMARATTETFSILLLDFHYRGRQNLVQLLQRYFVEAELSPNSYYMNHLMLVQLREGRHLAAWDIFDSMSSHVLPDLQTFACLWDCEKGHLDRVKLKRPDKFPGPRAILNRMMSWYSSLSERARDQVREECSRSLYEQVVRCMCLNRDLQGTIVALCVMKDLFRLYPDEGTARMVTIQVAQIATGLSPTPPRSRRTSSAQAKSQGNVSKMNQLLQLVKDQRAETLEQRGIDVAGLDEGEKEEELLAVLVTYLQTILRQTIPEQADVEEKIESAARDMGVPGLGEVVKRLTA
ncbi:MAG: hypothetical protein HETSPECPRED_001901 [Heterodermia speciosa]|uniref:Pentatricopeptide repeat protein n=1 Tax=Heterodermia speciosa TaxID=116794 RepID=A0A8H3PGG4_9LECA|nr:MAG: hypothetical protein HETSPECPRED_001901 [Heterodermia speciosa]